MSKKAQKSLEQAVRKLKSYKPERVILFGSYAWGTPGKGSDLDLFIVKKTKKRKIERTHEVTKLVGELPLPFDL
ncbi:MAG: nucleotidyltransferase domain-containing protein, partial [bacterium]|nr:nucleotidyltransferase domain-containing protein [bacterium]